MPVKTKTPQPKTSESQSRDCFQTPNYATKLLIPYIPKNVFQVWESACGEGKIESVLREYYSVLATDITGLRHLDFLNDTMSFPFDCIITNPPFSLKKEFAYKCLEYSVPWALLIPFDISGWICDLIQNHNVQFLLPSRRINYITPNTLKRIAVGELAEKIIEDNSGLYSFDKKNIPESFYTAARKMYPGYCEYQTIHDVPPDLLKKYSSADFHSVWMIYKFDLPKQITVVELTKEMMRDI